MRRRGRWGSLDFSLDYNLRRSKEIGVSVLFSTRGVVGASMVYGKFVAAGWDVWLVFSKIAW